MNNHMISNVSHWITYQFTNLTVAPSILEINKNFHRTLLMDVITYPCWGKIYSRLVKGALNNDKPSAWWLLHVTWWRHQMETFSALLALCAGNSPVTDEFPLQRPVTRSFDVFFDLRLNKRLSKQSWGWWSETPASSLWRHCNVMFYLALRCSSLTLKHT